MGMGLLRFLGRGTDMGMVEGMGWGMGLEAVEREVEVKKRRKTAYGHENGTHSASSGITSLASSTTSKRGTQLAHRTPLHLLAGTRRKLWLRKET